MRRLPIIIFIIFYTISLNAQDRRVLWLHGHQNDERSWNTMETRLQNDRRIITGDFSPSYTSIRGFNTAFNSIRGQLSVDNTQTIVVGHSMGGLLARHSATIGGLPSRGIVTIGTPHHGVALVNNIRNGQVRAVINNATNELTAGPVSEVIKLNLNNILIAAAGRAFFAELISNLVNNMIADNQVTASANQMAVGSTYLNNLNSQTSNVPVISIWGNEHTPVHWRHASSLRSNNADDVNMVRIYDSTLQAYSGYRNLNVAKGIISLIASFFKPQELVNAGISSYRATQWNRGVKWLKRSESIYNELMDCTGDRLIQRTITVSEPICTSFFQPNCQDCFSGPESEWVHPSCFHTVTKTITVPHNLGSDGFVCKDSQIYENSLEEYEAIGANHSEEVVHISVRRRLNDAFSRPGRFRIEPRG